MYFKYLITASLDNSSKVIKLENGEVIEAFQDVVLLNSTAISSNGQYVMTSPDGQTINVTKLFSTLKDINNRVEDELREER